MAEKSLEGLLVFADDWGRHPSSCQHLVRRLRRHYRVLWVNSIGTRQVKANAVTLNRGLEKIRSWQKGLTQVAEQMWVIDLPMLPNMSWKFARLLNTSMVTSRLKRALAQLHIRQPTVLTTLPYMDWLIREIPRRKLIYYCTDDYSYWPSSDRDMMQQADRELSGKADLILAASQALVGQHDYTGRCRYFPHGVDVDHFRQAQDPQSLPEELAKLPGPRIGFFGLIYEKINFDLLSNLARQLPNSSLVMIGPIVFCPEEFTKLPNVHLLGPKPYEELPKYLSGLDVLLLPYVDDPMIRQSGPLKLRECLAAGKPTVSIDVPDVRRYQPLVRIGGNAEAFVSEVQACIAESGDKASCKARQDAVANDSWDQRAELLQSHLREYGRPGSATLTSNGQVETRKRVLHLRTIVGKGGGPEKTLLNSPRFLRPDFQARLLYIRPADDPDYDMPARAQALGVDLVDVPEKSGADPQTLFKLMTHIRSFRPDILHAHDYKTNLLSVILGRIFNIPVVTTLHGYVSRGGKLEFYYQLDRWALRYMHHVIAVSPDLYQYARELGLSAKRCTLVENAIDATEFTRRRSRPEAKARLGLDDQHLVIGAVGRLAQEKGFDVLIRSVGGLIQRGLAIKLIIAGEGEYRSHLEQLSQELNLGQNIRLLGHRADTLDLYEAMDVFVLSSLREGLPNVLLEALAMEVPVVATRIAGVPRLISDGENGLLVDPDSVPQMTAALGSLLGDPSLRARLAQAGRRTVETRYSFAVRMQKIQAIYDGLLSFTDNNVD